MARGTSAIRLGLAVLLLAGAVVAGVIGFRILGRSLNDGQIGFLIAGLALGAAVFAATGISAWLVLLLTQGEDASSVQAFRQRRRVAFSILVVAIEVGLTWLSIKSAARHHSGSTWITGVLALVTSGLVVPTWFSGRADIDDEVVAFSPPVVLAEASLGIVAVGLAGDHKLVVAWLLAGLAIAESAGWMVLPEALGSSAPLALLLTVWAFSIIIPAASAIGALVNFAIDGNVLGATLTGVISFAVLLFVLRYLKILNLHTIVRRLRASGSRDQEMPKPAIPGATITVPARLAGLVIPLGTVVWAVVTHGYGLGTATTVRLLSAAAWIVLAAITLLLIQGSVIAWLRPVVATGTLALAAYRAQREGGPGLEEPDERDPYGPLSRMRRDPYPPSDRASDEYLSARERAEYYERERGGREPRRNRTVVGRVVRPLGLRPDALSAGLRLAESTGLNVDRVWPRLQLVVPPDVRGEIVRKERMVAILRVTAASAICAALTWPISAGVILTGSSGGVLAVLVVAPLAVSAAVVVVASGRLADVYLYRVRATDIYRFDLVRAMHLPLARDDAEFAELSRYIDRSSRHRPIVWAENAPAESRTAPSHFPETLATEVAQLAEERIELLLRRHRELLLKDRAELMEQQRIQFRDWLSAQALGPQELAQLAEHIADRAAAPVSAGLNRRMVQIQEEFTRGLRATLEEVIGESVLGPGLTNFTGYLSLELHQASEEDPEVAATGGTIRTGPGHELALLMSVVRNPVAARVASLSHGPDNSFLVLEPFVIEGGQDAPIAEFDAVADCATLTPLPRRRDLNVAERASTPFRFKLPDRHGQHELWFQLYQAGRLIQAVAISVEVRPEQKTAR